MVMMEERGGGGGRVVRGRGIKSAVLEGMSPIKHITAKLRKLLEAKVAYLINIVCLNVT